VNQRDRQTGRVRRDGHWYGHDPANVNCGLMQSEVMAMGNGQWRGGV
jgi:hypothetical protein